MSAVRNLNGQDCGGRPLRIDLADSDPFLEGKTTVRGEIIDAGDGAPRRADPNSFLSALAPGVPPPAGVSALDSISQTLATMAQPQLIEVLAQMKVSARHSAASHTTR
jgi:cleavage stimulation factor subunit 2